MVFYRLASIFFIYFTSCYSIYLAADSVFRNEFAYRAMSPFDCRSDCSSSSS